MRRPSNLSPAANRDINSILERSARVFGEAQARTLQSRLYAKCQQIADGADHGHTRSDIPRSLPTKFTRVGPFLIVYDPGTRTVDRVVDGRRDLPKLLR